MAWLYLAIAIVAEVIATAALKASDGFNNSTASMVCIAGYGVAYAIWSGAGIVLITAVGALWFKQLPDLAALIGVTLIISGVLVINLFSKTVSH